MPKIFIQILYADESVEINKGTLEVSQATYERGKELFKEGSISKADLAQLESQVSNDQYQLVTAEVRSGVISYNSNNCSNWRNRGNGSCSPHFDRRTRVATFTRPNGYISAGTGFASRNTKQQTQYRKLKVGYFRCQSRLTIPPSVKCLCRQYHQ